MAAHVSMDGIAQLRASWRVDRPLPDAETRAVLELPLTSVRELSRVRRRVREFLTETGTPLPDAPGARALADLEDVEDLVERAILVIDEMASNAVRHGSTPAVLQILDEQAAWMILAIDSAPHRLPEPAIDRPAGQGGYGLYVIADQTTSHGVHCEDDRKLVWATIDKNARTDADSSGVGAQGVGARRVDDDGGAPR